MIKIIKGKNATDENLFIRKNALSEVSDIVKGILENVRKLGDQAVLQYTKKFDKVELDSLEVSRDRLNLAVQNIGNEFYEVLKEAAKNISAYHEKQVRQGFEIKQDGAILGQKVTALKTVGIYVPGGKACYPSTVLMNAIPAKIAGVEQIIMVTPYNQGTLNDDVLAAAVVAGVDRVFAIGGAQAVGALAYGTQSIPKCDKIVGPGNAFVAEAKKQIFGECGIDMIAGPSEILIVSDAKTPASFVAADLLSQAEHDQNASSVLVTDNFEYAQEVALEVDKQMKKLPKYEIAKCSIEENGKIIVCDDIEKAISIANRWAPEHLELCLDEPFKWLEKVENAGSVFLGRYTPEAIGDYWAGANHTLPTSGTARFSSALSVDDFVKKTQYIYYEKQKTSACADKVALFAEREGLSAHARSVLERK